MTRRQRPPISPEAAAIVRAHRMSRRSLFRGTGALGLGAALGACGTGGSPEDGRPVPARDRSDDERIVNWANWAYYLDYDDSKKVYPTLERFQEQTQIRATYTEDIDDNDAYFGKISGQLKNGQDIGKDIIVFSEWMVARCVRQGYVQKIDKAIVKNARNLIPELVDVDYDPGRNYSLAWQGGYAGLAWNKKAVEDLGLTIRNVSDLWDRRLRGRVAVLSEYRDTIGLILREQGVDINAAFGGKEFDRALEVLKTYVDSGHIRKVTGGSYVEDLANGDVIAVIGWSGDIFAANVEAERDAYEFLIPEAGGCLWSDNMMIPVGSPHKKNAEILMNYYYDPVVAAEVAAWVNYICPVQGAQEEMAKFDPSLVDSPYIFPTPDDLAKVQLFRSLTPAEETEFTRKFQSVLGV